MRVPVPCHPAGFLYTPLTLLLRLPRTLFGIVSHCQRQKLQLYKALDGTMLSYWVTSSLKAIKSLHKHGSIRGVSQSRSASGA